MNEPNEGKSGTGRWRFVCLIVGAVSLLALWAFTPLRDVFAFSSLDRLRARLAELGNAAPLVFVLLSAAAIACGAPRLWFAALGGVCFGWVSGSLLSTAATLLGSTVTFFVARALGRTHVAARIGPRFARLEQALTLIGENGVAANVLLRAAPVGNCFAVNLFMGVSPIPVRAFALGTLLGTLPETVIYSLLGSSASGQVALRLGASAALLVLLFLAHVFVTKRWNQRARRKSIAS